MRLKDIIVLDFLLTTKIQELQTRFRVEAQKLKDTKAQGHQWSKRKIYIID
jgi:hypothetical protein